jgi:hypothetical protein
MADKYIFRKPVHRHKYSVFRRRFFLSVSLFIVVIAGGIWIFHSSDKTNNQTPPISDIQTQVISDQTNTYVTSYFQFQDTGKWVLDKHSSTATKFHYLKYNGQVLENQLIIYVNQEPPSGDIATLRVLPVRIASNETFETTGVSDPCGNQYTKGESHAVKTVTINGASMYCDSDTPLYSVVISEIGGDYHLNLRRPDGSNTRFIIIYRDMTLQPNSNSLLKIANSFKVL